MHMPNRSVLFTSTCTIMSHLKRKLINISTMMEGSVTEEGLCVIVCRVNCYPLLMRWSQGRMS